MRVTVKIADYNAKNIKGTIVSPSTPTRLDGTYWGYTVRLADSITKVWEESPYEEGYDLKIGTSERGSVTVDDRDFCLPKFKHNLIVFGGVSGIEECIDADDDCQHVAGVDSNTLFDMWLNVCPFQGSRTIRTEEAVLLTLSRLKGDIRRNNEDVENEKVEVIKKIEKKTEFEAVKKSAREIADGNASDISSESDSD